VNASAAIKAALRNYEPTAEQWDAITDPLEPVVIRAGAGSGKTAVMTARMTTGSSGSVIASHCSAVGS